MKKFISVMPLQPKQNLIKSIYKAVGNEKLNCGFETAFPVITLINGFAKKDEKIEVIILRHQYANSIENYKVFEEEISSLSEKKGFSYELNVIDVPYDNSPSVHLNTFAKLAEQIDDEDCVNACVTYGTKPLSQVEIMAINFAYRAKRDCTIGAIVYGEFDHNEKKAKVYDITNLFFMDEMVRTLAEHGVGEPMKAIKSLAMIDEGEE